MDLFLRLTFGVVYTAGYLLATLFTAGGGHGTQLLVSFFFTWFLFLICLVMLSWADSADIRKGILVLMFFNYVMSAVFFLNFELPNGFSDTIKYAKLEPVVMAFSVGWF